MGMRAGRRRLLKYISVTMAAFLLIGGITGRPAEALANSPAPIQYLDIELEHVDMPSAAYVDILVPIKDEDYTEEMPQAVKSCGFSEDTEAAGYRDGAYVSYMFHHKEGEPGKVLTDKELLQQGMSNYGDGTGQRAVYFHSSAEGREKFRRLTEKYPKVKLALLDETGNILKVSPECTIGKKNGYLTGAVTWDVGGNEVKAYIYKQPGAVYVLLLILFLILPVLLSVLLTVVTETAAGFLFRIRPVKWIIRVNLVSNPVFNLILFLAESSGISYPSAFLLLELAVIAAEWKIYKRVYPDYTSGRLLVFSAAANCISMAAGYFLNIWYL